MAGPPQTPPPAVRSADLTSPSLVLTTGMRCWARTARNATGVEYDHNYCRQWRQPAGTSKRTTRLICRNFYDGDTPDADIYTWWAQPPQMTTHRTLAHLAKLQRAGKIRSNAEAVFLSECGRRAQHHLHHVMRRPYPFIGR